MKIKNLIVGLLMVGLALSFSGCGGDEVINDNGEKVSSYGQFIEIKTNNYTDSNANSTYQKFMYDKDTKLCMYILSVHIQLLQCHIMY